MWTNAGSKPVETYYPANPGDPAEVVIYEVQLIERDRRKKPENLRTRQIYHVALETTAFGHEIEIKLDQKPTLERAKASAQWWITTGRINYTL